MFSRDFVFFSLLFAASSALDLPPSVTRCRFEDGACIAKSASEVLKKNPDGLPELGLPAVDPFRIASAVINEGDNGPLSFDLRFRDVEMRGLSSAKYEKVVGFSKDPKTSKFELYSRIPRLQIGGHYRADGRMLFVPIQGEGNFSMVVEDIKAAIKFKPKVVEKEGREYLVIDKMVVRLEPEKAKISLNDLFNGDKDLSQAVHNLLNDNWQEAWAELSAPMFDVASKTLKGVLQNVFDKFPYSDLFISD